MRILLAHSFYRIRGGEDRCVRQQAELLSRDHSVELFAGTNDELPESAATAARMAYSRRKMRDASRVVRRFRPEIVHMHNVYPSLGPAVHLAAEEAGVPIAMTVHNYRMRCPNGFMFTEGAICQRCRQGNYIQALTHNCFPSVKQSVAYAGVLWLHRFVARLENRVSLFICPSNFVRDEVVGWGISPETVITIPNFVYPQPDAHPRPGRVGVFVGRLSSEKGVDVLLEALHIAKDPAFRVVGDGPLAQVLRTRAAALGLRNTQFLGRISPDEVNEVLRDARFVALPSLSNENAPMAGLEALALGRPLLVTSRGGLPELVGEGTGLICRPGDANEIAAGIERLMEDDAFCMEAGSRGLHASRHQFGPEMHLARLETAYRDCIDRAATA